TPGVAASTVSAGPTSHAPIPFQRPTPPATPVPAVPPQSVSPQPLRDSNGKASQPTPSSPSVAQQAKPAQSSEQPLLVGLTALAEGWPESVRKEIVDLNLVDGKVGLPLTAVEQALKQGRIAFSWKTVRGWIKPPVLQAVSAHDGTVLELPLKVVAPLFLARQKENVKTHQK